MALTLTLTLNSNSTPNPLTLTRYETRNSGLFYLSATHEAQRFVATLADRVASEDIWDQSAWNQAS